MTTEIDWSRLTDTERGILSLLAEGHTAKSIAAQTGRSEGAVNERLREARRKTGVGSSRELARLLRAQENRDTLIGVAGASLPPSTPGGAPPLARWPAKVFLMTIILAALATAVALLHEPERQATPQPPLPPMTGLGGGVGATSAAMRATFAGEARDPAWAERAEQALRRRYAAVGGIDPATLAVACHATLCEAGGRSAAGIGAVRGKRSVAELASPAMRRSVSGLHADETNTGSNGEGAGYAFEFSAIWRRTAG